jgi:hypothetical protein
MIEQLFCRQLRDKVVKLEQENTRLKDQLAVKQEHINDVNRYWKKKLHEQKRKVKHVRVQTREAL